MANPQKENGYVPIANEIMENLYVFDISGAQARMAFFVFRETYGWNRKMTEPISLREIARKLNIPFSTLQSAVSEMIERKILVREFCRWAINKDHDQWVTGLSVSGGGRPVYRSKVTEPSVKSDRPIGQNSPDINKVSKDKKDNKDRNTQTTCVAVDNLKPNPEIKLLIDEFYIALKSKMKETPVFNGGAAAKGFKKLLGAFPRHDIQSRFNAWFASDDPHIDRRGWKVEDFFTYFNKLKDGPIKKRTFERVEITDEERHRRVREEMKKQEEHNERVDKLLAGVRRRD